MSLSQSSSSEGLSAQMASDLGPAVSKSLAALLQQREEECLLAKWATEKTKKGKKLLAVCRYNIFFLKENGKLSEEGHLLELVGLKSPTPNEMVVQFKRFMFEGTMTDGVDDLITQVRRCYQSAFPAIAEGYRLKLEVLPKTRLQDVSIGGEAGHCGGYANTYRALCDFFGLPGASSALRQSVCWDIEHLFGDGDRIFDLRKFNLFEFDNLSTEELKAIISPLRFNTFFRGIEFRGIRMEKEIINSLLLLLKFNNYLEELTFSSVIAPKEFFAQMAESISENKNLELSTIDFSNSVVDDKALTTLSTAYLASEDIASQLKILNFANTGITKIGMKALFSAMRQNNALPTTLQVLDISNNKVDSTVVGDIAAFLVTPNVLHELNLSNINFGMEPIFQVFSGCFQLRKLDVSHNKLSPSAVMFLVKYLKTCILLEELNLSDTQFPPESVPEILCAPSKGQVAINLSANNFGLPVAQAVGSAKITNVSTVDFSDNDFKDEGVASLAEGLSSCRVVKRLIIDRCFTKGKSKNFSAAMKALIGMCSSLQCGITSLSMAGGPKSQIKGDLVPFLLALSENNRLTALDVSGNDFWYQGASAISKLLQTNTTLKSLKLDENNITLHGFAAIQMGLERNNTILEIPTPIIDLAQILKGGQDAQLSLKVNQIFAAIQRKLIANTLAHKGESNSRSGSAKSSPPGSTKPSPPTTLSQSGSFVPSKASTSSPSRIQLSNMRRSQEITTPQPMEERVAAEVNTQPKEPAPSKAVIQNSHDELRNIIKDKKLALLFREYLHNCFNSENFSFWLEVEDLRNMAEDDPTLEDRCQQIYKKYFDSDSQFEVNLDNQLKTESKQKLGDVNPHMFDKAQEAIWGLMVADCVPKFVRSPMYKEHQDGTAAAAALSTVRVKKPRDVKYSTVRMLENFLVSGGTSRRPTGGRTQQMFTFGPRELEGRTRSNTAKTMRT